MEIIYKDILKAVCAGVAISIGCVAYLSTGSALTFPIGLFIVCTFGFNLFTGKVCFAKLKHAPYLVVCLVFNLLSAFLMGYIIRLCKPNLIDIAVNITSDKLNEGLALIPLAILCNVLIFVAVSLYRNETSTVVGVFGLYLSTAIFVMCGFEHCVANAFYFGLANKITFRTISYLLINIIFNAVGGILSDKIVKYLRIS